MGNRPRVTVLGSLNMDISVTVPRLPEPGATVLGSAARFTPGGKGANQAVAAARLGAAVRMTGCVGDDDFGRQLLAALRDDKVDVGGVRVTASAPTGLAMISVDQAGETVQAFRVEAVDTVGAGDTFVGALAVTLAAGVPAAEAVRAAAAAAATAATRPGAQAGMPRPADIRAVTGLTWPVR